jgi:hypothetical protein
MSSMRMMYSSFFHFLIQPSNFKTVNSYVLLVDHDNKFDGFATVNNMNFVGKL